MHFLSRVTAFAGAASALTARALPNSFTLIVSNPGGQYDGAKIQYGGALNLFQERVRSYCPESVGASCPNGTESVFGGGLYPFAMVPGGQDTYVTSTGLITITVQHSHSIPPDAFWAYQGFRAAEPSPPTYPPTYSSCPASDSRYDCTPSQGLYTWRLDESSSGSGLQVCPNEYDADTLSVYATTPAFNRNGCVGIAGLSVRDYAGRGSSPPVWSYV